MAGPSIGRGLRVSCPPFPVHGGFKARDTRLLGAVGESLGMDRLLKFNTSKTRKHSLFRQG
jgi:hypothetical protein